MACRTLAIFFIRYETAKISPNKASAKADLYLTAIPLPVRSNPAVVAATFVLIICVTPSVFARRVFPSSQCLTLIHSSIDCDVFFADMLGDKGVGGF